MITRGMKNCDAQNKVPYIEHIKMLHEVSDTLLSNLEHMELDKLREIIKNYEIIIKHLLELD